jgi:flagellar protein FliT
MAMSDAIAVYEQVLALMSRMRIAAEARAWDELVALERQCRALVADLRVSDANPPLDRAARARKIALIREMLAHDAAIRDVTEPWMRQLQELIGSKSRTRRLAAAYGAHDRRE